MNPHAKALGKLGGKARALKLTKEQCTEIARLGGLKKGLNHKKRLLDGDATINKPVDKSM